MDIDLIFQIAGIGIVVAVLSQLLSRSGRDEQALMITIAGLVIVLFILTEEIGNLFDTIKRIFNF
ncbi:MAG: stage III sporulation protein AC [Clostridia bacterium]|nr:stage III sporulation protein AC [Clostridia bacterium]